MIPITLNMKKTIELNEFDAALICDRKTAQIDKLSQIARSLIPQYEGEDDFLKKQDIKDIIHYNLTRIRTLKEEVASIQETNTITYEE